MGKDDKSAVVQTTRERSALLVATLTSFIGPFMISSVNVALPVIQQELRMDAVELSWIATSYLLAIAVFLLPAGKLADIHGRKRIFAVGLAIYTVGATLAAFANSAAMLISMRVIQGIGGALFVTTGMAILTSIFPPQKRGRVIGIYVSAVYVGLSMGPFAGGYITHYLGWRAIFLLMAPFGAFSLYMTLRHLKGEWYGAKGEKLDVPGSFYYGFSIIAFVYGATKLPELTGIILSISGLLGLVFFIWQQKRSSMPLFHIELFSINKVFAYSSYAALLNYSATFGITFMVSLYLQFIKGMSPQAAGSVLMAQPVMMALLSPLAGRFSDRIEPRILATAGMTITAIGVLLFSRLDETTPVGLIIANLIFLGTGFALFSSPNMSAMMGAVEKRHYGLASGLVATMRLLGQMCSMALATVVLALLVGREAIAPENYDRFLASIEIIFVISGFLCILGVYFSWSRGRLARPGR
ncbi:MFS transporter [Desulfosediminicola sp.]|uniref:MFS transporter n=1 Tax=Desulfosediminicola sp. TaxID=2886825 RepID=UPI003AF2E2FA